MDPKSTGVRLAPASYAVMGSDTCRGIFWGSFSLHPISETSFKYQRLIAFESGQIERLSGTAVYIEDPQSSDDIVTVRDRWDQRFRVAINTSKRTLRGVAITAGSASFFVSGPSLAGQQKDERGPNGDDDPAEWVDGDSPFSDWPRPSDLPNPPPVPDLPPPPEQPTPARPIVEWVVIPGLVWKYVRCDHSWTERVGPLTAEDKFEGLRRSQLDGEKARMRQTLRASVFKKLDLAMAIKVSEYICMQPCRLLQGKLQENVSEPIVSDQIELTLYPPQTFKVVGSITGSATKQLGCHQVD